MKVELDPGLNVIIMSSDIPDTDKDIMTDEEFSKYMNLPETPKSDEEDDE